MIESDNEPDYLAIRRALAQGNAAVMVGAGFSLNADGGENLATWETLAEGLRRELEPSADSNKNTPVLQLGEQYARVFSVPALEEFIKKHVPDEKVAPGLVHQRLLELPWTDIFTTNYDTLLERAADEIVEPPHYTVICREDIPKSKIIGRRRIVKLHGSFPSQRPFIFTEEDYRRYPVEFAPFVNMVRQALLENIFCLVGFSGDDPNFLHWIGWVRDMLDEHALPIYFFVPALPPLGQRKLLEVRKIIPIVLPLSAGVEKSDYKSRYLDLFKLLAAPIDPPVNEWGDSPNAVASIFHANPNQEHQHFLESLRHIHELRKTYPGWIIAPPEARRKFSTATESIIGHLHSDRNITFLTNEAPALIVAVADLYVWRQQVLLQPVDDRIAVIALKALGATAHFKVEHASINLRDALAKYDSESRRAFTSSWLALGIGLLEWGRQELEDRAFSEIANLLKDYAPNDSTVIDNIAYQSTLLHIGKGETELAKQVLLGWTPTSTDSYMHVRRGALLAEVNEVAAGLASCMEGIRRIRKAQKQSFGSASLLSRKAWACTVTQNVTRAINWPSFGSEEEDEFADTALSRPVKNPALL